jgi:sugar lactone lactonase YvrE
MIDAILCIEMNPDCVTMKGIAVSSDGHVYVTVMGSGDQGYVIDVHPDGKEVPFQLRETAVVIALRKDGRLVVPASSRAALDVYEPDGTFAGTIPHGIGDSVSDIVVSPNDEVFIPFFGSGKLLRLVGDESAHQVSVVAEGLGTPGGIAMDRNGHLYISDFASDKITILY